LIDVGRVRPGTEVERVVQLFSPDGEPFRIGHVGADLAEVEAVAETPGAELPIQRIRIAYRAGDRLGHVRGAVQIATDRVDAPFLDIPVAGEVEGPIAVSPATLQIERADIGKTVRRTLFIRTTPTSDAPTLTGVEAVAPWELIDHSVVRVGEGGWMLHVDLRFPEGAGSSEGELWVRLKAPGPVAFRVPLWIRGWSPPAPASPEEALASGRPRSRQEVP
jgi:hypothetical protein